MKDENVKNIQKITRKEKKKKNINRDKYYKFVKFLYFIIYSTLFIIFIYLVHDYSITNTYEDEDVIIKEMPLGYNVYEKNGKLKEVNFFNGKIGGNKELTSYVNNQLLFEDENKDFVKGKTIILKEPTNIKNSRTKKDVISDIYIKKILKLDEINYMVLFIEKKKDNTFNYCFKKNSLDFTQDKNKTCILSTKKKLGYSFSRFGAYYLIGLDDHIYFYNSITKTINLDIRIKGKIIGLDRNKLHDIKVISSAGVKTLSHVYIEYFLIKRIKLKKEKLNLNINQFF